MKCKEICNLLEKYIPKDKAYSWDNVGLLVGKINKNIKKIYIAVDATDEIIECAIKEKADMILCHHPLIFSPLKTVTDEEFISNRVVELLGNGINLYAMHTNYDVIRMADVVADKLELSNQEPLEYTSLEENLGLGKVGELPEAMSLTEIAQYVKGKFSLPGLNVFPVGATVNNEKIKQIAVLPGSGKSAIETVINKGIKVYITGDIGHHDGVDSASRGLSIIDAGHYGLEHVFLEDMEQLLKEILPEVEVVSEKIKHPFYCV